MAVEHGTTGDVDLETVRHVLDKMCEDLAMLLDRPMTVESLACTRSQSKVAGERQVHIAFRLGFTIDGVVHHGALLVPLPDAISMACFLMMMADDVVADRRAETDLERSTKDAMVEVGNLIGGSTDGALRDLFAKRIAARAEGCQGLRPGVAPAFERVPGVDLLVARAKVKLHTFPSFEALLMLPAIQSAPPAQGTS